MSEPLASVEFELAWAPHLLSTMDYTYRERHGRFTGSRACPREGGGRHAPERLLPPQHRLKLPGGRHRHSPTRLVGVDPRSRKIPAQILAGVPDDEQAKPAPDHDPGIAGGNTARVYNSTWRG